MSFPGIGITKTPYYRMHEESNRARVSESRTKHLNDLKFGIFPKKAVKIRHYSLENIKRELFEVYKYKNELEESKNIDVISKKLRSIVRSNEKFWGKSNNNTYTEPNNNNERYVKGSGMLRGLSSTVETSRREESQGPRYIFTKGFKKIVLNYN